MKMIVTLTCPLDSTPLDVFETENGMELLYCSRCNRSYTEAEAKERRVTEIALFVNRGFEESA